ncbi:UDP-xylose and UDP-N-acetylglucosamine transporter-like isoform X1 [Artemia franciscana]|uniref:UDP-xylose and UDP-N-acetylglucosamine transporter n=2 Tax=Artemia franciscana TaxID=6661 RepID=A0AA88L2P4_ARTSF|nr:hypothetical protein QYM36_007005 [Artemia franciscana]
MDLYVYLYIFLVFIGCCSNVIFLELLTKFDPGSGNVITFSQFVFISIIGFIGTMDYGRKKPAIPMRLYFKLVLMFFLVSVTNNYALNFNISMPLHMIFRAGSLMANMVMGIIYLNKKYSITQYLSVGMISIGIFLCTIASSQVEPNQIEETPLSKYTDLIWWIAGIFLLTFALFLSARMGIYQEVLYKEHGKHPYEALFFMHALPMPGFLLLMQDLKKHFGILADSEPVYIFDYGIPVMILFLVGNVITQYVCISSVFVLTTECTSLTVTLVLTLRKFVSLLLSIVYFGNAFTLTHWSGTGLVFTGTMLFSNVPGMIRDGISRKKVD